jgi:hypothetical protein
MAIPFADILQTGADFPVRCVGVYTHFNDIVFYTPSERICTERVNAPLVNFTTIPKMYDFIPQM